MHAWGVGSLWPSGGVSLRVTGHTCRPCSVISFCPRTLYPHPQTQDLFVNSCHLRGRPLHARRGASSSAQEWADFT